MSTPFLYQLLSADFASLSASDARVAVVDIDDSKLDTTQVQSLQDQGKTLFTYLSIGEAENYRSYWIDGNWSATPPPFLLTQNPDWEGNFRVKFWDPAWQEIVFDKVDAAIAQGYDGAYLDIVDAYQQLVVQNAYTGANIRDEMTKFVIAISQHAKAINPDFKIIPQNAVALIGVGEHDSSKANVAYLNAIDGVGVEDLWYEDDLEAPWTAEDLGFLKLAVNAGKFVLATSYPTEDALQAEFIANAIKEGFIPFVADRSLSGVIDDSDETISALLPATTTVPWGELPPEPVGEAPTVTEPVAAAADEDSGALTVDLLDGASDADDDPLSVTDVSALPAGVTRDGATLSVDTDAAAFQSLAEGATREIVVTYKVSDGTGHSVAQTATITVTGVNDAPTVAAAVTGAGTEDSGVVTVNLLSGAADVDGDTLSVDDVSELPAGVTLSGSTLSVDTSDAAFQDIEAGATRAVTVTYTVIDGKGGSVEQTATVTITGANAAPTLDGPVTGAGAEDSGVVTVDLLAGASDADEATLAVSDVNTLPAGVTLSGASLSVDTNNAAFQSLAAGATRAIAVTYNVVDGKGGSVAQTATVTITGVNDAPAVAAALTGAGAEDSGVIAVNLLAGATDVDGDALSVTDVSALPAGVTLSGSTLNVDSNNAAFQSLAAGVTRTIAVTYNVDDGKGGEVAQTANVTVTGVNDAAAITGAATGAVTEDGTLIASGTLTVADADAEEKGVVAQTATAATYGSFSIDKEGAWTYTLDNANAAVQALNTGQTITDTVSVKSLDGTASQDVVITISGVHDANPIDGTANSDNIRGTSEADFIQGFAGNDEVSARSGNDIVFGGDGSDRLYGGSGNDEMHGGTSRDLLEGDDGDDHLYGDEGRDEINAGDGNDHLYGGADEDDLSGENGDDVIDGGAGDDWLSGAFGSDTFVFTPNFGDDVVDDFDANPVGGQDFLDISAFGITAADFATRVSISDGRWSVYIVIDGHRDQTIVLEHVRESSITIDDFILAS